jgi:predicted  nucleic acid-binding Zn-ribbon protein
MSSRDKPSSQHQAGGGGRSGNSIASGQQVNPGATTYSLVDVSNHGGAPGRQSNTSSQHSLKDHNTPSMDEFLMVQESRMNGLLQHSAQQIEVQRSTLQQVANHLSATATNIGHSIAQWIGHPASEQAANLYHELEKSHSRYVDVDTKYRQLKDEYQALEKRLQESNTKLENAIKERDEQRRLAEIANWTGATKVSDDAIQSKWKQLEYNIRAMGRSLAKCQTRRTSNVAIKDRLSMAAPRWPKLSFDDNHTEFVISAYIWTIVQEIIEEGSEIWGGDHGVNFKAIRTDFIGMYCRRV